MFCRPDMLRLLHCIIETIQMTEGRIRPAGSILGSPVIAQRGVNIEDAQLQRKYNVYCKWQWNISPLATVF
jgi:hypothetical protein